MSLLTPSAAKGQPFFEGASSLRQHDNASDNMAGGVYSHNPLEGSATEADEWTSIMLYLFQVAKAGGGAIAVRNTTGGVLNPGPVKILTPGYDAGNSAFLIGAADAAGNSPANALLLAALPNNTNGTAYLGGSFTGAIDTSASTIGNPVYLAAGGGMTLTAPTGADQIQQVIGRVQTLANPGTVAGLLSAPTKLGTSFHQALSVTNAQIANATLDLTTKVTGVLPVANGGTGAASLGSSKQPVLGNGSGALTTMAAPTSSDANADAIAGSSAASKKALVLQGSPSQSVNLFEIQNSAGIAQFAISLGSATVTGPNNTNLGVNAGSSLTLGSNNTNVGINAGTTLQGGSYNTNVGSLAGANVSSGNNNTIVGKNAAATLSTGSANIVLGADADLPASGTSNTFVAGSPANPVSDVYFGKGVVAAASGGGSDWNLNGNGGNGTNQTGGNLLLAPGKGTGNAEPGLLALKYPLKSSSGSTLQTLSAQKYPLPGCLFTAYGATSLASAAGATDGSIVPANVVGTQTIEGGLLRVGRTIRLHALGAISTSASPVNLTVYIKLGSTTVATVTNGSFASLSATSFEVAAYLTCILYSNSGNTLQCEGYFREYNPSAGSVVVPRLFTTGVAVDVTANQTLDLRAGWAAGAGQTLTLTLLTAEYLN